MAKGYIKILVNGEKQRVFGGNFKDIKEIFEKIQNGEETGLIDIGYYKSKGNVTIQLYKKRSRESKLVDLYVKVNNIDELKYACICNKDTMTIYNVGVQKLFKKETDKDIFKQIFEKSGYEINIEKEATLVIDNKHGQIITFEFDNDNNLQNFWCQLYFKK